MNPEEMKDDNWYCIENIDSIDSPAFVVYPQRVQDNIQTATQLAGDTNRLRPHVKTHKSKEVVLMMMEQGIFKFKCATIAEAEMLALCKAKDVLLAYQPVGPKQKRFLQLISDYPETTLSCLIDNPLIAEELSQAAVEHHLTVPVYVDLNAGMNRTGIAIEKALSLYTNLMKLPGIRTIGLHVYDGHIHHASEEERKKACDESFTPVEKLRQKIIDKGFAKPVIIAGGSLSFLTHCKRKDVECSPGTFVYWDWSYQDLFSEQPFQLAALVITRVVSLPDDQKVCLDLGHKSIASENDIHHRVFFLNAPELKMISHSEEHLVAEAKAGHHYKPGDVLYGAPFHVCPTAALYERAITIENNKATGEWKTIARDRSIRC